MIELNVARCSRRSAATIAVLAIASLAACEGDSGPPGGSLTSAPTVTLSASPTSVGSGGTTTLSWSSTDATSCTASGGWSGAKATSGNEQSAALSQDTTFTLQCSGERGTGSANVTVIVSATPGPSVTLSADPTTVTSGETTTLTWTSTDATECTASGGWSGPKPTIGSEESAALVQDATFTLTCSGEIGSNSASVTVTVTQPGPPVPTVTLSADPTSVPSGDTTTLSWSSTDATTCTASGGWSGTKPTSGSEPSAALSQDTSFTLECSGAGGTGSDSVTVTIAAPPTSERPDQIHLAWVEDPSTTLTIVWRTLDTTAPSDVQYRPAGTLTWQRETGAPRASGTTGTLHEVTLRSLASDTAYEYRVFWEGVHWSEIYATRTAPAPGAASFTAIYVADTGLTGRLDGLARATVQVRDEIAALHPTLVLPGGGYAYYDDTEDNRYGTLDDAIDAWFNQMQPIAARSPLMPTYGDHEEREGLTAWRARFPTPNGFDGRRNFSFDVGNVHFVSIFAVSDRNDLPKRTRDWIEQDIRAAEAAGQQWIIPYFHVSPFSDGSNHPSNLELRKQLGPLFESVNRVKLVLSSHDQSYERTYPLEDIGGDDDEEDENTPTSSSKTCYTMNDGVTWAKISPGGKLSNINQSFSRFVTEPPPAWTAVRSNSHHHFARLVVSAAGSIRLETYGVTGDGSPPVLIDQFQYTTGVCPP